MDDARDPADVPAGTRPDTAARGASPVPGEIVSADDVAALTEAGRASASLVTWLEQTHRDAAANRAQARELVRTLEQMRDAQEYMGRALRDERSRSRRAVVALALVPLLAALLVWGIWDRVESVRSGLDTQVRELAAGQGEMLRAQETLRIGEAAEAQRIRAEGLESELDRVRASLSERIAGEELRAGRRAADEAALRARLERLEDESEEAGRLRAQLSALRSRAGADEARARSLADEVRRLERELGAAQAVPATTSSPTPTVARPESGGATAVELPAPELPAATERAQPVGGAATAPEPPSVDPTAGAVRRPADLQRIRDELNRLLANSTDSVRYRLDGLGGVKGETLLDVRLVGLDDEGRTVRTMEATNASVHVRQDGSDILIELRDGHLLLAGRKAPFFDDRYAVTVTGDVAAWKGSGLSCLTFD